MGLNTQAGIWTSNKEPFLDGTAAEWRENMYP